MSSELEYLFDYHVRAVGLPPLVPEHKFHPKRKWRFDRADLERRIAVEIEGGTWVGGRHNTGSGFEADAEKYNEAALLGWIVLRFTGRMVEDGRAIEAYQRAIAARERAVAV